MIHRVRFWGIGCFLFLSNGLLSETGAQNGQLIVRFESQASARQTLGTLQLTRSAHWENLVPKLNLYLVKFDSETVIDNEIREFNLNPDVLYAQKDHRVSLRTAPNDPLYETQWALHGMGASHIDAEGAWKLGTGGKNGLGQETVVAVVDDGADISHEDLTENLWVNKGEIPGNGLDDDKNGYIDDISGWNTYNDSAILPAKLHGTHVCGIVGARGNNQKHVVGVNWNTKILIVAGASSTTSVVAKAYGYLIIQKKRFLDSLGKEGANIVASNSSFGIDQVQCNDPNYQVWNDLYDEMGKLGILSVVATANLNINVDEKGDIPSTCESPYLIAVTNTTQDGKRYFHAGVGKKHVDLGAPGTEIVSLAPKNQTRSLTGTSMATPHVSGAISLLHHLASTEFATKVAADPAGGALVLKRAILTTVDPIEDLRDVTVSGGRLNLYSAVKRLSEYK